VKEGPGTERLRASNTSGDIAASDPDLLRESQAKPAKEVARQALFDVRKRQVLQDAIKHMIRGFHRSTQVQK
jgi:hypothetical protein